MLQNKSELTSLGLGVFTGNSKRLTRALTVGDER